MKNKALLVAGIIFGLFAIIHLIRLFVHFEVIIAGNVVPYNVSIFAFIIAAILSIWMLIAMKSSK